MTKHIIPGIIEYTLERPHPGRTITFQVQWQEPELRTTKGYSRVGPELAEDPTGNLLGVESQAYPELRKDKILVRGHYTEKVGNASENSRTSVSFSELTVAEEFEAKVIRSIQAWADLPECKKYFKGTREMAYEQLGLFE